MFVSELHQHNHKLVGVALITRGMYIVPAFVMVLVTHSVLFNVIVTLVYLFLCRYVGSITLKNLYRFYRTPLVFILSGCIPIAISFNGVDSFFACNLFSVGFIPDAGALVLLTVTRSVTILSMLCFGLLTHTISEISEVMRKSKVPAIFIELFVLTYKFIENLISAAHSMYIAQKCRLTYGRRTNRQYALSLLVHAIFRKAIIQTHQLQIAIQSRSGINNFDFVREHKTFEKDQLKLPVVVAMGLLVTFLMIEYYGW